MPTAQAWCGRAAGGGLGVSSQACAPQARELQHTIAFLLNSSDSSV